MRRMSVGISTVHGRSMTRLAMRAHVPSSLADMSRAKGILILLTLGPSQASTAGRTIVEYTMAMVTAIVPPMPKDGSEVLVKKSMPIRPMATVIPE